MTPIVSTSAPTGAPAAKPTAAPVRRSKPRRRSFRWILWTGLAALALGGGALYAKGREAAPVAVATARVERGSVRDFVTSVAAGRVAAKQEATLRAEIAGRVDKLRKRRGDRVKAGEPLLSYDTEELRERVRLAQSAVDLARAHAVHAEQGAANASVSLARTARLHATGAVGAAEVEDLEGQSKALARAAEASRMGVSQALASLELARTALAKAVVKAPFAATVLDTRVEEGETTAPGAPLVDLADTTTLHVDAEIDEADLGRVALGMPVDVSLDAFPQERIRASLSEIAPSVTRDARGERSVAIEIALPEDPRLRVGMSADVDVIVAVREGVLHVPPAAVQGRGAERAVFVMEDGRARRRPVEVGISTWEAVEVKTGLQEGDEVFASLASTQVKEGSRVIRKAAGN